MHQVGYLPGIGKLCLSPFMRRSNRHCVLWDLAQCCSHVALKTSEARRILHRMMKCCLSAAAQVNPFTTERTGVGIEARAKRN
jgi:hypothetical protein